MKFKVGDVVIGNAKASRYDTTRQGWIGEVVGVDEPNGFIYVRGKTRNGGICVFEVQQDCFDPYRPMPKPYRPMPKIVITTDGKTTTAQFYEGKTKVKSAEARCNPKDTFDFAVGAELALDRLLDQVEAKPMYKVGQYVRVIDGYGHNVPVGQIVRITSVHHEDGGVTVAGYCRNYRGIGPQWLTISQIEALEN